MFPDYAAIARKTHLLRGNALRTSQVFAVAVGGDRRKRLIQILPAGVGTQFECAPFMSVPVSAEIKLANGRAVGLEGSAVMSRLAENRPANKNTSAILELALNRDVSGRILRIHRRVDRAS